MKLYYVMMPATLLEVLHDLDLTINLAKLILVGHPLSILIPDVLPFLP